ncbi:MAG: DUF6447 family protein [Limnobacter sp.]|jgi:hypothetical protein|nr:DUF6447 family protein [Limnobacter sp.]
MATVTIDGKPYELDQLSDVVKQQLMNLQVADQKIIALQQDLALMQTARSAYARILSENLPKQ